MADALLLEWEDVLVHTRAWRAHALARALEEERLPPFVAGAVTEGVTDDLDVERRVGEALARTGRQDDHTLHAIVLLRARRAFAERLAQGVSLVPGGADFIASCESRVRVVIVTGAARTETEQLVRQAHWDAAVTSIVAADDVNSGGGWNDQVARALEQLARRGIARAADVVMLGSSVAAFRAARSLGVRTVAAGAPAHVSVEADGAVSSLVGQAFDDIAALARSIAAPGTR